MRRGIAVIWLCTILILTCFVIFNEFSDYGTEVKGAIRYVNETGSLGAFPSIQDAINASTDGDTVFVYAGMYNENIVVNKTINLIGEDTDLTTINGSDTGHVVTVSSNLVNISGFTIKCGGMAAWPNSVSGIELDTFSNCRIFSNKILDCYIGINLDNSHGNNITDNNISDNYDGMWLRYSSNNSITHNTIMYNGVGIDSQYSCNYNTVSNNSISNNEDGMWLYYSSNNTISDNDFLNNNRFGITLDNSHNCSIINNTSSNGFSGIDICESSNITIADNILPSNSDYGISAQNSFHINAYNNNISDTWYGIWLFYVFHGDISHNNITSREIGIELVALSAINVTHNNVRDAWHGIRFWSGYEDNTIANNSLSNNTYGIWYDGSYYDTISGNTVFDNEYGIHIWWSNNVLISHNHVFNNDYGVYYWENTDYVNLIYNNVSDNEWGIYFDVSNNNNNLIMENLVSNNEYAINLSQSSDNTICHNNFINNTYQANDDSTNTWDNDYPSGGNYWSDYSGVDYYKGPSQNMPGADGVGDTNYTIDSDSKDNYPLMEPYTFKPFENYTILYQGWNLVSIPLIQDNQNLTKVLEMIDGYYSAVKWYDASDKNDPWKNYVVGKPFGNDLFHLNETMGFWIYITHPGETIFLYNGTEPTVNQTIQLYEDWNMVGYPTLTSYNRTNGLNNLTFGTDVDCIQWYDAATETWYDMGTDDCFVPCRGYWIHAIADCEWEVPL